MAQPQPQLPQLPQVPTVPQISPQISQMQQQRASFSPTQHSPSPAGPPQPSYALPPNKRPRTETGPSAQQPATFLNQQSYAMSPQSHAQPTSVASPNYTGSPSTASPQNYAPTYPNGGSAAHLSMPTPTSATTPLITTNPPALTLPETRQTLTPSPSTPVAPTMPSQPLYTSATMAPIVPPPGAMGPPSKPAERPTREYEYDVSDSLAGTGIDLRAEEQYLADLYAGSFGQDARTGLPANAPGSKASMYGAGWANQPPQPVDGQSQEQFAAEAAKKAWEEAAQRLAVSRSIEMRDPFLQVSLLHHRAEKIAKEHGVHPNLDLKNAGSMGKLRHPLDFSQPKVTVTTRTTEDGGIVSTKGSWVPHDAYLADQLALLSIATKHRLRTLLEEACLVAINRQTTSHGEVPEEWDDVAVPLRTGLESLPEPESAVSPRANPLKRPFDVANPQSSSKTGSSRPANPLTKAIRDFGEGDRKQEDFRLKKRQKRLNPDPAAGSRSGSIAPGTPGSVAPETESKAPSKKELKKSSAAARLAEASSTANANQTLSTLMGGFGGRKKGKQYSWMTSGGSGASTPNRLNAPGTPGSAAVAGGAKPPQEMRLTQDGKTKWGTWREYTSQGKNIQLRDWVTALEMDGIDAKAIQNAYVAMDVANAK